MDSKECSALLPGSGKGAVHPPLPAWPWEAPSLAAAGSPNSARQELGAAELGEGPGGAGPEAPGSPARTNGQERGSSSLEGLRGVGRLSGNQGFLFPSSWFLLARGPLH